MLVKDVMTLDVVTATAGMPLSEVADTLVRERLRAIPVIDEEGHVLGLITDRQVMTHFLPSLLDPDAGAPARPPVMQDGEVRDVMERTVMCVNEDEPLGDVVRLMLDKEIERLPVVREGILVGFLTRGDIIRRLLGGSPDPAAADPEAMERDVT
jgi:CBS domain-containing protein